MATRAPVHQQQQRGGAAAKPKPPNGRARTALGDIGNVVTTQKITVAGKAITQVNRPITRSFGAQLLAKAQAAAAANKNSTAVLEAAAFGKGGAKVAAPAQKAAGKQRAEKGAAPKPNLPIAATSLDAAAEQSLDKATANLVVSQHNAVIEVTSDADEEMKSCSSQPTSSSCSAKRSSKKHVRKTLSSVLTARSKAACDVKEKICDIDAEDADNELAYVEYVEDLYKYYRLAESSSMIYDYMDSQPDITPKMRSILADWLIEVHNKFELMPETLYLTMHIVDRFLSVKTVLRRELQLVGISAMLIACKYEEIWAPEVNDFVCISDQAYSRAQILVMEKLVLNKLEWSLTIPTAYGFLSRFIKAAQSDKQLEHMAYFFGEMALVQYCMIMYSPSVIAASSVYAAQCTLKKDPLWTPTLKLHTGFTEAQLRDCAKLLVKFHSMAAAGEKLKAVQKKYSTAERSAVALLPPATKLMEDR